MRTRSTLCFIFATGPVILLFFLSFVTSYDESPWQPVVYDYYQIDLSQLGGEPGENLHSRFDYHHGETNHGGIVGRKAKGQSDRDVVVDIVNNLGIKLLAIHNEHNENNIALSPYGTFSVLAALLEGLQGEAVHEILHSTNIPKDKHVVRVGLRDIHRHLKSYFIPEEGFLAGLTLNLNNVTLRSEYEEVLHFYGFDYGSFNNALYPEPPTTKKSVESTTLETGLSISEDSTVLPEDRSTIICSTMPSTVTTGQSKTIDETSTTEATVQSKLEENTEAQPTTQIIETTTIVPTYSIPSTFNLPTTLKSDLTTTDVPKGISTTTELLSTSKDLSASETSRGSTTPKQESTTTILQKTTSKLPDTTTLFTTTATSSETTRTVTTVPVTQIINTITQSSLPSIEPLTMPQETTTKLLTTTMPAASTSQPTTKVTLENTVSTTQITVTPTTADEILASTVIQETTLASLQNENIARVANGSDLQNISLEGNGNTANSQGFIDNNTQDVETATTDVFFGTTPEFQDLTPTNPSFDFQNYQYDNGNPPIYDDVNMVNQVNVQNNPPGGASLNNNFKRNTRSVVDYVIARFYDDHPHYQRRHPPHYVADDPLTFAMYGKYRETGVNFMKYDTVLPYYYARNLNAWALSFPLDSTKYYLLLLLPFKDDGVDQLICDFRLHGDLRYIIENLRLTHVMATIPSFTLKGYVTLTPSLQTLGIRKIFEPRQADFSQMTNVKDIYVTNIEQAVTVTIRNYLDPSAQNYKNFQQYPPVPFKADHPFLYFVMDSELNVALMVGKVVNPLNSRIR